MRHFTVHRRGECYHNQMLNNYRVVGMCMFCVGTWIIFTPLAIRDVIHDAGTSIYQFHFVVAFFLLWSLFVLTLARGRVLLLAVRGLNAAADLGLVAVACCTGSASAAAAGVSSPDSCSSACCTCSERQNVSSDVPVTSQSRYVPVLLAICIDDNYS